MYVCPVIAMLLVTLLATVTAGALDGDTDTTTTTQTTTTGPVCSPDGIASVTTTTTRVTTTTIHHDTTVVNDTTSVTTTCCNACSPVTTATATATATETTPFPTTTPFTTTPYDTTSFTTTMGSTTTTTEPGCTCHLEPCAEGGQFPQLTDFASNGPNELIADADAPGTKVTMVEYQPTGESDEECRFQVSLTLRQNAAVATNPYHLAHVMVRFGKAAEGTPGAGGYRRLFKITQGTKLTEMEQGVINIGGQGGEERELPHTFTDTDTGLSVTAELFAGMLTIINFDCGWEVNIKGAKATDRAVWVTSALPDGTYSGACGTCA